MLIIWCSHTNLGPAKSRAQGTKSVHHWWAIVQSVFSPMLWHRHTDGHTGIESLSLPYPSPSPSSSLLPTFPHYLCSRAWHDYGISNARHLRVLKRHMHSSVCVIALCEKGSWLRVRRSQTEENGSYPWALRRILVVASEAESWNWTAK